MFYGSGRSLPCLCGTSRHKKKSPLIQIKIREKKFKQFFNDRSPFRNISIYLVDTKHTSHIKRFFNFMLNKLKQHQFLDSMIEVMEKERKSKMRYNVRITRLLVTKRTNVYREWSSIKIFL